MAGGPKRDQTCPPVCPFLVNLGLGALNPRSCSSPGPARLGNHVITKKCNWPQAQYWGGTPDTWVSEEIMAQR